MADGNNIKIIKKGDANFPWMLEHMDDGPESLYCIGKTELLDKPAAAVVGARKCSEYGRQTATKIAAVLAEAGIVTVSGMAEGTDAFAHMGAMKKGGETIAVLGSGPDICYPLSNRNIYDKICRYGLVISEYPPGTKPRKWHFPRRNRIIVALSQAVIIAEAGLKSGALITALKAAELGKEVMAVPGNINSPYSIGCNKLIADGAAIVTDTDDVLRCLGIQPEAADECIPVMGEDESTVYKALLKRGEAGIDQICFDTGKTAFEVSGIVTAMEMKGLLSYSCGKIYIAKL